MLSILERIGRLRWLPQTLMGIGTAVAIWTLTGTVFAEPVILLGVPDDLGNVDGTFPYTVRVGVFNLRPSEIHVDRVAAGCSNERQVQVVGPFSTAWIDYPIDMPRFRLGPQEQVLTVHGNRGGKDFVASARFRFDVRRGGVPK